MHTISNLKDDLTGGLHGGSLNKVKNINNLFFRAASQLLLDLDPQETVRTQLIENALYDRVYQYALPPDVKGNKIIDIRPIANRTPADNFNQTFNEPFDLYKKDGEFTIENDDGVKTVKISTRRPLGGVLLHDCESPTGDGTWTASAGASNLRADSFLKLTGGASIRFDLTGNGVLEISDMAAADLSEHDEQSALFLWLYAPALITGATLRWGNDAANYWEKTIDQAHSGAFQVGPNLLRFDWPTATETGAVDTTNVRYLRLALSFGGALTKGFRLDSIYSKLPSPFEIEYYSKYLFRSADGTWKEKPTSDSDIINLDTDSYGLFTDLCLERAAVQIAGEDSKFDASVYTNRYSNNLKRYRDLYPSEAQRPRSFYYRKK